MPNVLPLNVKRAIRKARREALDAASAEATIAAAFRDGLLTGEDAAALRRVLASGSADERSDVMLQLRAFARSLR